jgi:ribonuclease HI
MWNMIFNGDITNERVGADVWISPPKVGTKIFSFKLAFDCTNNMVEYEALILGLRVLKELGAERIVLHGHSERVISQVKLYTNISTPD